MAIADDWSVDFTTGNIRYTGDAHGGGSPGYYTVLELHRYLGALADDAQAAGGANDDVLDISALTPSDRVTDQIIDLLDYTGDGGPRYNIDDASAEHLYGGSLKQGSAETEELYSGLRVLGSVASTGTTVQIVQDKALIDGDAPFWGDQTTPFNGDVGAGVLMRLLVKSRVNGADIDNKNVIVQVRNYGDSYAFFSVELGTAESVAAVSSVDDPQNDTAQGTVTAYTHVTNTEGFQTIDIGDGNGAQPYYSKWTYGADTASDQLKSVWEWGKDLTATGTAKTIHGIDGELFRGITHSYSYDNLSGTFQEDEEVVWGTGVTYDTLAGGTFTAGNYIRFSGGAAGRVMYDNGSTDLIIALEDVTQTIADGETMTEYNVSTGASGVTAAVNVTVVNNDKEGGLGILLANDTTGTKHHLQLRTGKAPVDNLPVRGLTSAATADVNGAVTAQTVNPVFLGSYVGSMIGGFGVGFLADDLSFPDTVIDLDGDTNSAPNNVTWSLNGIVVGEDRILVGEKETGVSDFNWNQTTLTTTLNGAAETSVVIGAVADNTPQAGWLRITLDDGRRRSAKYSSWTGTTFTLDVDADTGAGGIQINVVATAGTFTRLSGSFLTDGFEIGMRINGTGFANGGNNTAFTIAEVTDLVITVVDNTGMVDETGSGDERFTVSGHDFTITNDDDATSGNNVMVAPLDMLTTVDPESFTAVFTGAQTLWVRVRDGGATPIKTYEAQSSLGSGGGSATASRISDA